MNKSIVYLIRVQHGGKKGQHRAGYRAILQQAFNQGALLFIFLLRNGRDIGASRPGGRLLDGVHLDIALGVQAHKNLGYRVAAEGGICL